MSIGASAVGRIRHVAPIDRRRSSALQRVLRRTIATAPSAHASCRTVGRAGCSPRRGPASVVPPCPCLSASSTGQGRRCAAARGCDLRKRGRSLRLTIVGGGLRRGEHGALSARAGRRRRDLLLAAALRQIAGRCARRPSAPSMSERRDRRRRVAVQWLAGGRDRGALPARRIPGRNVGAVRRRCRARRWHRNHRRWARRLRSRRHCRPRAGALWRRCRGCALGRGLRRGAQLAFPTRNLTTLSATSSCRGPA